MGVYVPTANAMTDESEIRAFVGSVGVAELVTVGPDGFPLATLVPLLWDEDRAVVHLARMNPQWESIADGSPVLLIVTGSHGYVSPSWYAAKAEHGRVVPTWNYSAVHLRGRASVFRDTPRLREAVTTLTRLHEDVRPEPWAVDDAPADYIEGMLKAIVGVEIMVSSVEAKAKLSQNRSEDDQRGVIVGLRAGGNVRGEHFLADSMERHLEG